MVLASSFTHPNRAGELVRPTPHSWGIQAEEGGGISSCSLPGIVLELHDVPPHSVLTALVFSREGARFSQGRPGLAAVTDKPQTALTWNNEVCLCPCCLPVTGRLEALFCKVCVLWVQGKRNISGP